MAWGGGRIKLKEGGSSILDRPHLGFKSTAVKLLTHCWVLRLFFYFLREIRVETTLGMELLYV